MALIRVECGGCGTALQVRAELAGQQGRCPKCGAVMPIPTAAEARSGDSFVLGSSSQCVVTGSGPRPAAPGSSSPSAFQQPAKPAAAPPSSAGSMGSKPAPAAAVPSPAPAAPSSTSMSSAVIPLGQAMAPDMLRELHRRKKSAVMVVFDTPTDGSYLISRKPEANVRVYGSPDMNDAQVMQVLEQIGHMSQGVQNQKGGFGLQPEATPLPFELKGDRLGMSLDEFKTKYSRQVGGMLLPYCSDSSPGQSNPTLWSEPWHASMGLVNGRIDLPSENSPPTIAGVKTESFIYHFVDGKLFRMTILFDTEQFHLIHDAVLKKYGPPQKKFDDRMEMIWDNGVSTIKLVRGSMRPKKHSSLIYVHGQLQKIAEGRTPQRATDL
jgi:hypothetical protein